MGGGEKVIHWGISLADGVPDRLDIGRAACRRI